MLSLKQLIFPSMQFEIKSKKTPEEIASLLGEECTDNPWGDGKFRGKVTPTGFKLIQNPPRGVRNSGAPVIIGEFSRDGEKNNISIKMRIMLPVQIFHIILNLPLPFLFLAGVFMSIINGFNEGFPLLICPIIFFALGQLIFYIGFWRPAKKAKEWLETWLA